MNWIEAISKLWPVLLVILGFVILFVFKSEIKNFLRRANKLEIKTPTSKVSISSDDTKLDSLSTEKTDSPNISEEKKNLEKETKQTKEEPTNSKEWSYKMIDYFFKKEYENFESAYQKTIALEQNTTEKKIYESMYNYLLYLKGEKSSLNRLESIANDTTLDSEVSHRAWTYIGYCYESIDDYKRASLAFDSASKKAKGTEQLATDIVRAATNTFKDNRLEDSFKKIESILANENNPDALRILYEGLSTLYELQQNYIMRAFALDKALEYSQNNVGLRFNAAYAYSKDGANILPLYHYRTLLSFDSTHSPSLNNIGLAYDNLSMPIKSIKYYVKSYSQKSTLSAANIAYKYIDAGFEDEANKILTEASKLDNVHANVNSAKSYLTTKNEDESKTEADALKKALEQRRFIIEFMEHYYKKHNDNKFLGSWISENGLTMDFKQSANGIESTYTIDKVNYKYQGDVKNNASRGHTLKIEARYSPDFHFEFVNDKNCYMYLDDSNCLHMITIKGDNFTVLNFKQQ